MRTLAFLLTLGFLWIDPASLSAQSERAFGEAYRQRDWKKAAAAAELWGENEPENSAAAYNAACARALGGDSEAALAWLERAGKAGFAGVRSIEEDPDLESVRDHAGFEAATWRIRDNRARMFEEFKSKAEASEIYTIVPTGESESPRPLILVLHGYGGEPKTNAEMYREVAAELDAIVAAPGAIRRGPQGQGYSWTFRDEAEWWVLRATEKVSAEHRIDEERIVLAGFSQGANAVLSVGLKHPDRFVGLLSVSGHYEAHLMKPLESPGPRVYLLIGEQDQFAATFRQAESDLRRGGQDVRLRVVPGLGHTYPRKATAELRTALRYLLTE